MQDFSDLSGLNLADLNAATASEQLAFVTAFCWAVAKTHPTPLKLLSALNQELKESATVYDDPTPELQYAMNAKEVVANSFRNMLTARGG